MKPMRPADLHYHGYNVLVERITAFSLRMNVVYEKCREKYAI